MAMLRMKLEKWIETMDLQNARVLLLASRGNRDYVENHSQCSLYEFESWISTLDRGSAINYLKCNSGNRLWMEIAHGYMSHVSPGRSIFQNAEILAEKVMEHFKLQKEKEKECDGRVASIRDQYVPYLIRSLLPVCKLTYH